MDTEDVHALMSTATVPPRIWVSSDACASMYDCLQVSDRDIVVNRTARVLVALVAYVVVADFGGPYSAWYLVLAGQVSSSLSRHLLFSLPPSAPVPSRAGDSQLQILFQPLQ